MTKIKMNKSEFSGLSYKELQAIAVKYRVPGNIKKKILVKVLDAIKIGNELEVAKLLGDVQNTRKKRTKKMKLKPAETPLPLTSNANYHEEKYLVQLPYQWSQNIQVAAEEEVVRDDKFFTPNYADFRHIFMRSGYPNDGKINERSCNSSMVDLRVGEASLVQAIPLDIHRGKNIYMATEQDVPNFNYQVIETENNFQTPVILKKMLQAPMGVNLKEIATDDIKVMSNDQTFSSNFVDDSDTLTAESDSNANDDIDNSYFCIVNNNEKNHQHSQSHVGLQNGIADVNRNNYMNTEEDYRLIYQMSEQESQKLVNSITLNQQQLISNAELYQTLFFENAQKNDTPTPQYEFMQHQPYENNQITDSSVPYNGHYENSGVQPNNHTYYNQRNDFNNGYYSQCLQDNKEFLTNMSHTMNYGNTATENDGNSNNLNNRFGGYCLGYQHPNGIVPDNRIHENYTEKLMYNESKESPGMYWPHWTPPSTPTIQHLENVLNLRNSVQTDITKFDQTSSVYCYAAPVVSPKPLELNKVCSQQKRFIAEPRCHRFATKHQLYDDTSTGRIMANSQDNQICDWEDWNHTEKLEYFEKDVSSDSNDNLINTAVNYSTFTRDIQSEAVVES